MPPLGRNLLTDVPGLRVGHAQDLTLGTGTTVIAAESPVVAAADVRGGAPGTREIDLMDTACLVERIDAIVLSGGSAYGLAAADGVVDALAAQGRGFAVGVAKVPIVPALILFDLLSGPSPARTTGLYAELGHVAFQAATAEFQLGCVGAGTGATCGPLKGGIGSASAHHAASGLIVGAIAAVNANGSAVIPGTTTLWAWTLEQAGELGRQQPPTLPAQGLDLEARPAAPTMGASTTLAVVATNASLDKAAAVRVAIMAQDGFARALRPVHTPFDGDSVIVLATGGLDEPLSPQLIDHTGRMAADCTARAIARGVYEAESAYGVVGYRDWVHSQNVAQS